MATPVIGKLGPKDKVVLSRAAYHVLGRQGFLPEDRHTELLGGEIYTVTKGGRHVLATTRLAQDFWPAVSGLPLYPQLQDPVVVSDFDEPEPDLALIRGKPGDVPLPADVADVALIIEVSDSTLERDKGDKLAAYARAGVPEYWVINLRENVIEVRDAPVNGEYTRERIFRPGQQITTVHLPGAVFYVDRYIALESE
jgi:Uma2 family endonuclease